MPRNDAQKPLHVDRVRAPLQTVQQDEAQGQGRPCFRRRRIEVIEHELVVIGRDQHLAAQRDELRQIWSVVETLPKQQRIAMVLKFQEDMKIEDIAMAMSKTPGAVKLLIHRGVTKVRQTLGAPAL